MKVSFSLKSKATATTSTPGTAPPLKQPALFADDAEPLDAAPTASSSSSSGRKDLDANKALIAQSAKTGAKMSKAQKRKMEEELKVDQTVFEYDAVWDRMQEAKLRQKEVKMQESQERKPKYISGLLASAKQRKIDYVRAEEKAIQREREAEGDEFADKESFVTQAYKDQMEEVKRAEEEEKEREALEKSRRTTSTGMTHFYRQLLDQSEQEHTATVAATSSTAQGKRVLGPSAGPPGVNLTITKPADFTPVSDVQLAKQAALEGKSVELNDDNQIVDKRELLSAGLNLSAPNTRKLGLGGSAADKAKQDEEVVTHRAVGTAASRREIEMRRKKEIAQQMEEEKVRVREEHERAERERTQRIISRRNNEEEVGAAKQRYLERKRRKLEEPAGAQGDEASGALATATTAG